MRKWGRLLDSYIEEYAARGVSKESVAMNTARLERWGLCLKARWPRVGIERIDADSITRYIESCSSFRAKATVCYVGLYLRRSPPPCPAVHAGIS